MRIELMEQIEHVPMLPETVQKVEAVFNDSNATVADMANAIKNDPIITAYILKTANSPIYGLSRTVNDITTAVSLLGREAVRTFTIASAANSCMELDLSPYGMSKETYLARSQLQNALVSRWVSNLSTTRKTVTITGSYGTGTFANSLLPSSGQSLKSRLIHHG